MNRAILFILFTSFFTTFYSQDPILKGVIMDGEFNEPLIGVNVLLNNGKNDNDDNHKINKMI